MFPVGEANFSERKTGFWSYSSHKTAASIVSDFGKGGFGCGRGVWLRRYDAEDGVGGDRRRRSS